MALLTMVLGMVSLLGADMRLGTHLDFSLGLGPLIYFYVLKKTRPGYRFRWKDLLHFIPVMLQQVLQINPALQLAAFLSVIAYLYGSLWLIKRFYQRQKFNELNDRYRYPLRWLRNLLMVLGSLWLLWIPLAAVDHFGYNNRLGIPAYFPLYFLVAAMMIWIAAVAHARSEAAAPADASSFIKPTTPAALKQKGTWLKKAVKENGCYLDPELSLPALAEKLKLPVHELSRIINTALKKSFTDFINEYRVRDVITKMQDAAYDHITLLGIAYESGFNSKATFNRIFKQMTGQSPLAYKTQLKKEVSSYNLGRTPHLATVILNHETAPGWSPSKLTRNYMFKNYLKIAWRNMAKNKAHSLINVSGLAAGLVCSLLILLWVNDERNVDAFHQHKDRLFTVYQTLYDGHNANAVYGTPGPLADELKKTIPEVEYASGWGFGGQHMFKSGNKLLKLDGNSAQPDFFKMFSYPLLEGNAENALNTPSSLAISRKMAVDFFGSPAAAAGKTLRFDNRKDFTVSAVFEDLPANSSQHFEYLTNWFEFLQENPWATVMSNIGPGTYVQLKAGSDPALVNQKIAHFFDRFHPDQPKDKTAPPQLTLQPYSEVYLHGNFVNGKVAGGRIGYVNLFSIVAVFILLIACINFMNLATARSLKRAKEIGVRKVAGALRSSLIQQFIIESLWVTFLAVLIALGLLVFLLPMFNQLTGKQIGWPFHEWSFWLELAAVTISTGLLSGSYPALFLSSFKPVKVLKGTFKMGGGAGMFRKGLVVFQFVLSVILIISTLMVSRQVNYLQSVNLGYDRENLVYIPLEGKLGSQYEVFKQEALKMPGIQSVTLTSSTPTLIRQSDAAIDWTGAGPNHNVQFTYTYAGYDFTKALKLTLVDGRDFSREFPSDSAGFLINQSALKLIGYKNPIGKRLKFRGREGHIIGVLKDFHFSSLHDPIEPLVVPFGENLTSGSALVRTLPGQTKQAITSLGTLCKQLNPDFSFSYAFSDEEYNKLYKNEQLVGNLADSFAVLAIFISCLGLLGLAMFTAEQRTKEIGIRKVLGAGVGSLFGLLTAEFLKLILIALLIGSPLAWYALNKWLESFAYHAVVQWWLFALSAGLIVLTAMATVSFQAIKSAVANPIKSLRSE